MKSSRTAVWICGAAAVILGLWGMLALLVRGNDRNITMHIGTYGDHVYRYTFDEERLQFFLEEKTEARNASYVLADADMVFAVSECGNESGAYCFRSDGGISDKRQTGADPCFLMLLERKNSERFLLTADYSGGSISIFPVTDAGLGDRCQSLTFSGSGPVEMRQASSHIHQIRMLPADAPGIDGRWALASDLGADRINILRIHEEGDEILSLYAHVECPAGSGPRHLEFSKDSRTLYCLCELSGEVLVYAVDPEDGTPDFRLIQRIQADEVNAGGSADIHLHPSGMWLYTSHRLDNDGISIFRTLPDGRIEKTGYARTARHPRNFCISPDGDLLFAACRDDKVIQVFRIEKNGDLTLTTSVLQFEKDMPSSITSLQ